MLIFPLPLYNFMTSIGTNLPVVFPNKNINIEPTAFEYVS